MLWGGANVRTRSLGAGNAVERWELGIKGQCDKAIAVEEPRVKGRRTKQLD